MKSKFILKLHWYNPIVRVKVVCSAPRTAYMGSSGVTCGRAYSDSNTVVTSYLLRPNFVTISVL